MSVIDKKGKLFGKLNIIDLLAILLIVAVLALIGYKLTSNSGGLAGAGQKVVYTVEVKNVDAAVYESLQKEALPSQLTAANEMLDAYVTDIQGTPADPNAYHMQWDGSSGDLTLSQSQDGAYNVIFTIEGTVKDNLTSELGTQEIRVGKTHIAVALGVEAVRARKEVRFTDCAALVRDLKDASSRGILAKRLKYYAHATLLIIDELGYLDVDEEGADLLFQLVSARYEHRSTVITTNVAVGLWADVFGDAVTAAAIADRVCHHCTMLKITGRSYRMKDLLAEAADGDGLPERGQS